jgi:SAM-dependent methyltransferase
MARRTSSRHHYVRGVAQNIYDDPAFFAAYSRIPRSVSGLRGAAEWPTIRDSLLPDVAGARVVDLGCGFGWFCRWAAEAGAASVLGVDLSERMLARARADTADDRISYERQDLDDLQLPFETFDLAFSSLTLHYLSDVAATLRRVGQAVVIGGTLVCSLEHPIFTAPTDPTFARADDGRVTWPLDAYLTEGPRTTNWLAPGIVKQHRTISTYVASVIDAGFTLTHVVEWGPSDVQIEEHPEWSVERERPPFLLLAAKRIR